jgi:hypothetical protein
MEVSFLCTGPYIYLGSVLRRCDAKVHNIIQSIKQPVGSTFSLSLVPKFRALEYLPALLEISIVSSANDMHNGAFGENRLHTKSYYLCSGSLWYVFVALHAFHKHNISVRRQSFRHEQGR